jgi:isopropylmalate/homocitrate/citramalate synthase
MDNSLILFDTSLRDGIQNSNPESYNLEQKFNIFKNIYSNYNPKSIEIGSLSSPKILPIMKDTLELYDLISNHYNGLQKLGLQNINYSDIYVLIPTISKLEFALCKNIKNFTFITSVSEEFQMKNTGKFLKDIKNEFYKIEEIIKSYKKSNNKNTEYKLKLYISCINYCSMKGKIDNHHIIKEILDYHIYYNFDELCLSDTCGNLAFEDFKYIIDSILFFGVNRDKISLHLHVNINNILNVEKILFYSFDKKINKFDVSILSEGGCSVTMSKDKLLPNLSYNFLEYCYLKYNNKKNEK